MLRFENSPVVSILSTLEEVEDATLLTGLEIRNVKDSFTRDEITSLFEKLVNMNSLTSITLENCKLKDTDFECIVKVIAETVGNSEATWRSVSLCHNNLTDASISHFQKFLQIVGQNLESLDIDGNLVSTKFHRTIIPLLPQLAPNLLAFSALSSSFKTVLSSDGCLIPNNLFLEMMTITIELMGQHSFIRNISFSRYFYILDGILNVRHFPLITAESLGILTLLIHQVKALKGIVCNHCSLSDDAMETFCEAISMHQETLVSIELKYNQFSDMGLHVLAETIKSCRKLTTINITGNQTYDDGLRAIWNVALNYCRSLESFIANQLPTEPSARIVARMLGDFLSARLPLLCLHDMRIGSQCIIRRHSGMSNCNILSTTTVGGCDDSESVSSLTTTASMTTAPWEIVLHDTIFEEEDMRLFSIPMMRHASIVSVLFVRCRFSDKCLDDLARALAVNTSIERLYFINNMQHWTLTGVGYIFKALETNRSLRWVVLDKAPVEAPIDVSVQSQQEGKSNVPDKRMSSTPFQHLPPKTPSSPETPFDDHSALMASSQIHHTPHYRTDRSPMFSAFKSSASMASSASLVSFSDTFIERFMSGRLPEVTKFVKRGTVYLHRPSIVSKYTDQQSIRTHHHRKLLMVSPMASLETDAMGDFVPLKGGDRQQVRLIKWSQHRLQHRFLQRHQRNNLRFATQKITSMFHLAQVIQSPPLSPTSDENWLTVCVSDYSEEEFKLFLHLVYDASDRINLCYIRLTYVPLPYRYLLVPFLCSMLSNPNIAHNLDTLILGDFLHYDGKKLIIRDWDFSQNWVAFNRLQTIEQSNPVAMRDNFLVDESEKEEDASTIAAIVDSNSPLATPMKSVTPTNQLSPSRRLASTASPSAKILLMSSPQDKNHSLITPFPMTTPLQAEHSNLDIASAKNPNDSQQNPISSFFDSLRAFSSKVHAISLLTTDTDGIPLYVALALLHHCVKNGISIIDVNIKEDELDIRALLEILLMLSTIDNDYQISINHDIVCVKDGAVRIEQNFFCRSRPRLHLALPQLANNSNGFLGTDSVTLKMEDIRAIEDMFVAMDIYVQDIVQVDPALLTTDEPSSPTPSLSLISKASSLWIDRFNIWLQEHQISVPQGFCEGEGTLCNNHSKPFPKLLFFPHVYVDNPRMRDPFDRIHRELFWTSYLLELDANNANTIVDIVQQRSDISSLSFANLRLTDTVLQKLLKTESQVLSTFLRRLRQLNLSHNLLTDASLDYLSTVFFASTETNIQILDLSNNSNLTISGILSFISSINKLRHTSLTSIFLHHTVINEEKNAIYYKNSMSLIDHYPFFKDSSNVSENLIDNSITKPATVKLAQAMIDLLLTHSAIDEVSFAEQIHFSLNRLDISTHAHLLRQETQGIALVCASRSYITQLSLRHNNLQDDQVVDLSAAIQFLTSLEVLDVSHNLLSNVGMSLLAETLLIYGNPTTFRYVDFSYNNGHFAIPNVHQAIGYHVCHQSSSLSTAGTNKFASSWQPQKKLSYLRVLQCDNSWFSIASDEKYRTKIFLKDSLTQLYEPYVFIQTKATSPVDLQEQLMPVAFPDDISGGDILVDLSDIKVDSPTMRQQLDEFMLNAHKLYHQYQHNISTNAPMCTMSLILDRTILDSNFYASFPKYIDGIVTLSLKNAAIDDTKAMHLEYALSRSGVNSSSNAAATTSLSDNSALSSSAGSVTSSLSTSSFTPSSVLSIQLRSLQLQGNLLTEVGAQALLACAGQSPSLSLRTISLAENPLMRDLTSGENLARFATKRLPSMVTTGQVTPALLSLDLSYTCIQDTTASLLARTLAHPHCLLEALNISFTQISAMAAMRVLQSLNTNRGLKILSMNGINMSSLRTSQTPAVDQIETVSGSSNTMQPSSGSLRLNWKNSSLQSLSLRHCQLHPKIVHALLDSGIRSLEHLDVSHNHLPNVILMMVLLKLSTVFPQLQQLYLYPGTTQQSLSRYDPQQPQSTADGEDSSQGLSMSAVNAACTKEDLEMIALEILQEAESPLQKLVLYPFEMTQTLPKKTSDLMRCLYEDEEDFVQNSGSLYPDSDYCRHYYDATVKKLSIVLRDDEDIALSSLRSYDIVEERQRVNRNLFQNAFYAAAEEIDFVLLSPVLAAKETKAQSLTKQRSSSVAGSGFVNKPSSTNNLHMSRHSLQQSTSLAREHHMSSQAGRFTIWRMFLESVFFLSSSVGSVESGSSPSCLALKKLNLQFSVLYEEDVIALCQTLRTLGKMVDGLRIHLTCGVFVPMVNKAVSVRKNSFSAANAPFTAGQSSSNPTVAAAGTSLAPRTSSSQIKRFTTPTKVRVSASSAASNGSNNKMSPSAQKRLSSSNFSSVSSQSHRVSSTSVLVPPASVESSITSMMDALCLVPFISVFSLWEVGAEAFHDGHWQTQVYPYLQDSTHYHVTAEVASLSNGATDRDNSLSLNLIMTHFTPAILEGLTSLLRHKHRVSQHVTLLSSVCDTSMTLHPSHLRRTGDTRNSNPMRHITKAYLAKQAQRLEDHVYQPLRYTIAEKLLSALIPSSSSYPHNNSSDNSDTTKTSQPISFSLQLPSPPPIQQQEIPSDLASVVEPLMNNMRQEIHLLDLLAMLLRRNDALRHLCFSGVFTVQGHVPTDGVTSIPTNNHAGFHRLLDFQEALSSVVTAVVQNDRSSLLQLSLFVPECVSLHQHAHLLAPYLPAHVNDMLQSPLENSNNESADEQHELENIDRSNNHRDGVQWLSNEDVLTIVRNAFSSTTLPVPVEETVV